MVDLGFGFLGLKKGTNQFWLTYRYRGGNKPTSYYLQLLNRKHNKC